MPTLKKPARPPRHGTLQRYRLELRLHKAGEGPAPCDRCRSANSERVKANRANRTAAARRAQLTIVGDVTPPGHTDVSQMPPPADASSSADGDPEPGAMQKAVQQDIDEIDQQLRVPFHRSLSALALESAREIDDPSTSASARTAARKQLFEVLRSLRTTKEGDDNSAVAVALEAAGFGVPLIP